MDKKPNMPKEHTMTLINRSAMTLTGVLEVTSFTDSEIVLKTSCGDLLIRGSSLNIGKLNTDTGELVISGTVSLIKYSKGKDRGGVFEGLFR
ncbi:MAG: sporulation protein YabP [Clostridia bacterium]|nr:sporulation protein YabP [Clostridia bacterium]